MANAPVPPSSVDNDLSDERVTPDQSDADAAFRTSNPPDQLEWVPGHGKGRDLGHNPQFDGRLDPSAPRIHTDPLTGQEVITGHSAAMIGTGEENGEYTEAERTVRSNGAEFTAWTVNVFKGQATPLLGEDVRRGYTRISNIDTDAAGIIIGTLAMVNSQQGFFLLPGQAFEPQTSAPLYAICPTANASSGGFARLSMWVERRP